LTDAPWSDAQINERRLSVMNKCNQTRISKGFSLIIDDSGHRKVDILDVAIDSFEE
jgi:SRSO17 transposase